MMAPPNIIFIFSDQQRHDSMGCYGQKLPVTPNLDKMAKEGVKFSHAYSIQPVCGPARASIQTGKYPTEMGCFRNGIKLPEEEITMAKLLTSNGYEVGYTGKWHLATTPGGGNYGDAPVPLSLRGGYNGFWMTADVLEHTSHGYGGHVYNKNMEKVEFQGYRVDTITDYGIQFLEQQSEEKPFFLFVSYIEPHHQNDHNEFEGPEGYREKFVGYEVPADLKGMKGDWKRKFPDYLACCESLDENVGRLNDKLIELGLSENTVVIYTSDHGCHFRTRNLEYKRSCHDSSIHVPLIIKGPGFEPKEVVDEFAHTADMMPTVLDIAGVPIPPHVRGVSLKKVMGKHPEVSRENVFIQISESQVGRAIRTKRWKYSVRAPLKKGWTRTSASKIYMEDFLYDLEQDPAEHCNLVKEPKYKDVRAKLREKLLDHIEEIEGYRPKISPYRGLFGKFLLKFSKY